MAEVLERPPDGLIEAPPLDEMQAQALRRLQKKREFHIHVTTFVVFNALFWLIWGVVYALTGFWFPWPIFPLAGWAIGLGFHAWDTYGNKPFSREQIEREAARLRAPEWRGPV
jgi:2TM domain-containing protein